MEPAIIVENISKRYLIGHRFSGAHYKYSALRDVIAREFRNFARKAGDVARGRQVLQGDAIEEFWALKDVSFTVKQGEVLGIVGRNGAGKSTLLKVLSRITEPCRGRVVLKGRVASLLEIGTGFHPELTGRENIFLNGAVLGMTQREVRKKFDEIVAFSDVERFLDTPVKQYSSGMYVRLAFSVAAHLEPEILLVDEVLAVGDASFQKKCLGKIKNIADSDGRTVLFVSHNVAAIQQLCDRAIFIRDGRIASDGDPFEIVRQYLSHGEDARKVSVRDWKDRVTSGDARIVDFQIFDQSNLQTESVAVGQGLRFVISIEVHRQVSHGVLAVIVHSATGDPILELQSAHDGLHLDADVTGFIAVEVTVREIGLYPGDYTLSPCLWDDLGKVNVDFVKHCSSLRVISAPGGHGDLNLDPRWGKYYVPSKWSVLNDRFEPSKIASGKKLSLVRGRQ